MLDTNGAPLSGVGVNLSGGQGGALATDPAGNYSFTNLAGGTNYAIAVAASGLTFNPGTATFNNLNGNQTADFSVLRPNVANGQLLINEFRLRGPNGAADEYVELYNNTDTPITVSVTDGSQGWAVVSLANEEFGFIIPNGTTIAPRAHLLAINPTGYSLSGHTAADRTFTTDLPDDYGIALFRTSNPQQFTTGNVLDAVGFNSAAANQAGALASVYREGTPLTAAPIAVDATEQYAFVRKLPTGLPQDTGDNAQDFALISTTGTVGGAAAQLGAPSPENAASPIQRNATVKATLIDRFASATGAPNRVRDTTPVNNGTLGTLTIRRRFKNSTGGPVTALRFRIVDITTLNTPNPGGTQADLRGLDSVDVTVTTGSGNVLVRGTTIEQPPVQSAGGGLNSTFKVNLQGGALVNGASVDVQFVLGVQAGGSFRFLVNVEALP